ncbi:hypothetical protein NUU61_002480 [Penicillium alfredii]|uniref:Serine/arginine repetitive matrix protein 1 n=1 Tax=Penicillium alfredii TaxID=1506179 RepID=A0A9W9KGX4_9EURO|nr:uncharacterized protein NUU61_002480 [Penicillium alfredii]KAJ5105133.1 hypothetical protein NUU61_002480 [Penicillium alfredii]
METGPGAASRRSSPGVRAERVDRARRTRSRSPFHESSSFQRWSRPPGLSPNRDSKFEREPSFADHVPENPAQTSFSPQPLPPAADKAQLDQYHLSGNRTGNEIPNQPRNHSVSPLPPSGPHQGPRSTTVQNRGSHNLSMLSAPTRPRRGPGSRENPWGGTPPRRGPVTPASHPPPSGPRSNFTPPGPGGGNYRHPSSRQNSVPFIAQSSAPRFTNHLAGLCSIVPGGRVLPSALDPAVEKRLSQLEADQEKLHEQMMGTQKSKRAELRDWDKLDRESSISALKSELAEGHLQRMADESIGGGIPF